MRLRWIISVILTVVPLGSPSAQQSDMDTRSQIEQVVATFTERYNKQDAAAIASMFTKDAVRVSSAADHERRFDFLGINNLQVRMKGACS